MNEVDRTARELRQALQRGDNIFAIHYGCGDFFTVNDKPTNITAIAVSNLNIDRMSDVVFSIANSKAHDDIEEREKDLLFRFYEMMKGVPDARIVHWNMHSAHYGFSALAARYRYLFEEEPAWMPQSDRLYDLDSLITARHGEGYVKHPKLRSLASLNTLYMPFFRDGKAEAAAVEAGDYGTIERSTAEKARIVGHLFEKFCIGELRTRVSVGAVEFAGDLLDAVAVVIRLGVKLRDVERSLKRRHGDRATLVVKDEYDTQDLVRSMLVLFFADIRSEEWTPSYAGAASRIDFVMPEFELAVELKHTRVSLKAKELGEQIMVDCERYKKHEGVRHLVCLVFDHEGYIVNPRGIEQDLSRDHSGEDLAVTVSIFDR